MAITTAIEIVRYFQNPGGRSLDLRAVICGGAAFGTVCTVSGESGQRDGGLSGMSACLALA